MVRQVSAGVYEAGWKTPAGVLQWNDFPPSRLNGAPVQLEKTRQNAPGSECHRIGHGRSALHGVVFPTSTSKMMAGSPDERRSDKVGEES